ncbi:MAG: inositol monophosphatase family protein [Sulfurovaceae bacterium]|nr:inositol monophosphatase family protein [Sulfurovaceae bacterium]
MIEILKEIALKAGEIVKEGFVAPKDISHKGIVDLVTQYDVLTEQFLICELKKQFEDYMLIGEESHDITVLEKGKVIYIDPIDGTTNFIHGLPYLGISMGIWEDSNPVAGIVYNPILNDMFWAQKGKGAYCNGRKLSVSSQDTLQQALLATGFPYAKAQKGPEYDWVIKCMTNLLPNVQDIRRFGAAALDLCYLAQGNVDGFYEIDLKPWDVAAGIIILQEAGGKISDSSNNPYHLGSKSIVASNCRIHDPLCKYLYPI